MSGILLDTDAKNVSAAAATLSSSCELVKMTQEKGQNMQRYHQQLIRTNVDTVVSILPLSELLLCRLSHYISLV
jgi:hypothetical protein